MLWFILSIFIFSAFAQDTTPTDTTPTDTTPQVSEPACLEKLCRPWINSSTGTKSQCSRKSSSLDLRFILNLPEPRPETQIERATYAFCPVVDDVENFSLQQSASIAALDKDGNLYGKQSKADLWVYGMNDLGLAESPPGKLSPARVLVYDAMAPDCSPQEGQPGGPAFVTMLVFNVTLNKGLFTYTSDGKLIGNGFVPTCDSNNKCKLNPENKCIGYTDGAMNCAVCLSQPSDLVEKDLSIFATYYGTDARGHTLLSGSSNPLNYMVFSAGQLFLKIKNGILGVVSSIESGINKGSTA